MLFLALVIGVSLPCLSWTQFTVNIDGVFYESECSSLKRFALSGPGCPTKCSTEGEEVCAIRGIPYANASRFEKPKLLEATAREELRKQWKKDEPVHCMQTDPFSGEQIGTENCLVVDLYFPSNWNTDNDDFGQLVVIMEGMDFESSLAGFLQPTVNPGLGLPKHMIAVIHYRTGAFGFMTLQDQVMPANLGLWDQQMALQFLKKEANALKAKDDIIVLGFGSGAIAAHLQMLNPVSKELFKKVLLSGGNALSPGAATSDARNTTLTLAERLRCDISSSAAVAKCLREQQPGEILKQARAEPALRFAPTVDANISDTELENVFIGAPLRDLVRDHKLTDMEVVAHGYPALAGLNQFVRKRNEKGDADLEYLANFFSMYGTTTAASVAKTVYDQHYGSIVSKKEITEKPMPFIEVLTDFAVGYPVTTLVQTQARQNPKNSEASIKKKIQLKSFIVLDTRTTEDLGANVPSFASKIKGAWTDGSKIEKRFGSTLDDMLLFIGFNGIEMFAASEDKKSFRVEKVITDNAQVVSEIMQCLLDPEFQCGDPLSFNKDKNVFEGQESPLKNRGDNDPYRYNEISRWSSVLALASAMDRLEAQNRALIQEKEKADATNAAGFSFWAMLVAVIVLVVLAIILVGVVVKLVMEKRRATTFNAVEKPARSGAHYNAGMETVTVEEGNRL